MKIDITKKDIIWGYFAQFFSMASGILVLPFILRLLTPEEIGMNYLMLTVASLVSLFDFGFAPQFGRNFSYIFSGAQVLHKEGIEINDNTTKDVNYHLTKDMAVGSVAPNASDAAEAWTLGQTTAPDVATGTNGVFSLKRNFTFTDQTVAGEFATVYTFKLDKASGHGVNDWVSRKSDFIALGKPAGATIAADDAVRYTTDKTIEIWVTKSPKTGPVYHINNNIAK